MARLPNVSRAVKRWQVPVILKTVTITSVDFEESKVVNPSPIKAMVQASDIKKIVKDTIDTDLEYMTFHTLADTPIENGQFIEFSGKNFKLFGTKNHSQYGYYKGFGEEHKKALT
jgi:hypothetical protein